MENFDLAEIKNLSWENAKLYVTKYFVPLTNGSHAMLVDGEYQIVDDAIIKKTYFNRMSKELNKYYFHEYNQIKVVDYKLNEPMFFGKNKINLCPKMLHEYKQYNTFNDATKEKVNIVLDFIKEIWCSFNEDSYSYILKWLSNMIKGHKNNSCLYLKSIQGVGKSTITTFLKQHVIGDKLALECGSEPIKSRFNSILGGKLLVTFEELENFGINEWQVVSTVLKRNITSNKITLEAKGCNSYETDNINNYILLSNNDAIKDDDGRRYFILDINTSRLLDETFYNNIYQNCFSNDVGHAFYCYMLEINTDGFNPQKFPQTKSKLDSTAKRLPSVYQFLKDCYVLKNKDINCAVKDFHIEYEEYCCMGNIKALKKIDFNSKLSEININYYKSHGNYKYKVNHNVLLIYAQKMKWIHDLDEYKMPNAEPIEEDYKRLYYEMKVSYERLEQKLNEANEEKAFNDKLVNLMSKFNSLPELSEPKKVEVTKKVKAPKKLSKYEQLMKDLHDPPKPKQDKISTIEDEKAMLDAFEDDLSQYF